MTSNSDSELIRMVSESNRNALDQLFRRYYLQLRAYAGRVTADATVAEDIVQDIFFKLWVDREKLPVIHSVHSYLRKTTLHRSVDYLRKSQSFKTLSIDSLNFVENEDLHSEILQYRTHSVFSRELSIAIQQSIESLPDQCRMVFRLSRTFGMRNAEIAEYLNISVKAVEKHMTKALSHLRSDLKDYLSLFPLLIFLN